MLTHPELQHQETPELVPVVRLARLVLAQQPAHLLGSKPAAVGQQQVVSCLPQVLAKPSVERDAETRLATTRDRGGEVGCKRTPQGDLALTSPSLERVRQS